MSDNMAFWAKGNKIIQVQNDIHIKDICSNPEIFGFTKKQLEEIFNKYNEDWGYEGKAREEIMVIAMKNGWVRIRQRSSKIGYQWMLQYDNFSNRLKTLKEIVSKLLLDKKVMRKYDRLTLMDLNGNIDKDYFDTGIKNGPDGKSPVQFLSEEKQETLEEVLSYKCFNY